MHTEQGVQIRLTRVNRVTRVTRREFFGGKCLVEKISGNIFVRKQSAFREGRKYKEEEDGKIITVLLQLQYLYSDLSDI